MILEIVVSKPRPFAGVEWGEEEKKMIDEALEKGLEPTIGGYLHGKVEESMGYDMFVILNGKDLDWEKGGIYECKVHGYEEMCVGFFWKSEGRERALVVDPKDKEAFEYADRKYKKQSWHL